MIFSVFEKLIIEVCEYFQMNIILVVVNIIIKMHRGVV